LIYLQFKYTENAQNRLLKSKHNPLISSN